MKDWTSQRVATAASASLRAPAPEPHAGPERVVIDSRQAGPGTLFVGLPGERVDGGAFGLAALAAGAWGVLTTPEHAPDQLPDGAVWMTTPEPLAALQRLATAWRRALQAQVIGVTGSTGKTSTKELVKALLAPHRRVVASRANFNTEIGLPLELLAAPSGTEVLVLEMGMRGAGQIAELAQIAEPDVAVIVSIGPVHVELLGGLPQIAAAKAELIAALAPGASAVIPAGEALLAPHRRDDIDTVTFGPGGDITLRSSDGERLEIDAAGETLVLQAPFAQAHLRRNLLAAVGAARAVGVTPSGRVEFEVGPGRGQHVALAPGITLIDDSYNANPMSMRAALQDLAASAAAGQRRVAVLGDMLELGPEARAFHAELGPQADAAGVEVLVTVGPLAAAIGERFGGELHVTADAEEATALLATLLAPGDVVLVKASNGVGLGALCHALHGMVAT
ncbi:MAG TPA: UDP-N-acetylmuramoyl-tripeptide--D-alanyl-D-alanine ligase [Solirubrobacteraceae bacterium]|jgi:UDP-N-acetylmuramoyl-tripeptide--D-alanyl-D-alanine ligase|nr:UDP-N-acetylmuramoyl-tripeptide--D-alanyl-D-alanine ligase [Solirubrobacteraceae bacterium]